MKTINVSDELHNKLKNISEKSGLSIQEVITLIVEKGLDTIMSAYEFEIDIKDIEQTKKDIQDFIILKGKKEDDFIYTTRVELFKKPVMIIKEKKTC